ncbi:hypothetical protein EDB83DRAFT_2548591 [Lactarius deliciosus]|nr:hypothetical protein EDB83DRAFT_2318895 [Lactarius deliciosus]KAH9077518.1 hypothetical protein EDB83DRAFT_2548591 [Lactarius deliciosus]
MAMRMHARSSTSSCPRVIHTPCASASFTISSGYSLAALPNDGASRDAGIAWSRVFTDFDADAIGVAECRRVWIVIGGEVFRLVSRMQPESGLFKALGGLAGSERGLIGLIDSSTIPGITKY